MSALRSRAILPLWVGSSFKLLQDLSRWEPYVGSMRAVEDFPQYRIETPSYEAVAEDYRGIERALEASSSDDGTLDAVRAWDATRRRLESWNALTNLRFEQDTRDEGFKAAKTARDELVPRLTALDVRVKTRLLSSRERPDLERAIGAHAFALWGADVESFSPAIEADLTQESMIAKEYTELIASAQLEFDGRRLNLAGIAPYFQDPDRGVRHDAQAVRWAFFTQHKEELDDIYARLVRLRDEMARKLGYATFTPLGYKRMSRVDYGEAEVTRFRDEVVRDVVPLAGEILARRARRLHLDRLLFWDELLTDPRGNPKPLGDHDWIVEQADVAFNAMHEELGSFFQMMRSSELLDLKNRDGKAAGGFCTSFPTLGVPFIFANFNGTSGDVDVLVHESGHAFQNWRSRELPLIDYLWPTMESSEIDSIAMEYLALPQAYRFFGPDADRFRVGHLEDAFIRLPYMTAVDHFQHLVFGAPNATPSERNAMWQAMEARYLPWRAYADLEHPGQGGAWQSQLHIYQLPFYYIDYALATSCALQFWAKSLSDYAGAFADYVNLCGRGGSAPFGELVRSANLRSPFERGVLSDAAKQARSFIGL